MEQWRRALAEALGAERAADGRPRSRTGVHHRETAAVPELPPQEAQNRFKLVFRRFLGAFATPEHPLALFLDDLQWLDAATLDLIEHLVTHAEVRHLLLVGAYRDNEVGPAHPLLRTLEAISKAGGRGWSEIVLAPLGPDDVGRLVAECPPLRRRSARGLWRSWFTRRPAEIRSSRSSSSRSWPKKDCSRSTPSRRLAMGHRSHPRQELLPTTWWTSWPGS